MIIQSLTLVNFRQYRDETIEFKEGLIGIIGKNGSGKSTLFNALVCGLYGELPSMKEHIRSSFVQPNETVSVTVCCEIENSDYKIIREFKGKNLTPYAALYKNGNEIAVGATDVTRTIERIIGMPKEAFTRSVFAAQGELREISESRGGQRRELIRKMMGFQMLDDILQTIRDDKNKMKNVIDGQQAMLLLDSERDEKKAALKSLYDELSNIKKEYDDVTRTHDNMLQQFSNVQKEFEKQQKIFKEYTVLQQQLTQEKTRLENCIKNISETEEALKQLYKASDEFHALHEQEVKFNTVRKQKDELDTVRVRDAQKKQLHQQFALIEKQIHEKSELLQAESNEVLEYETILQQLNNALKDKSKIAQALQAFHNKKNDISSTIGGIQKTIKDRQKHIIQIEKLGRKAECPVCLRPLHDAYDATIQRLTNEIEEYERREMASLQHALQTVTSNIAESEKQLSKTDELIGTLQQKKAKLEEKQNTIKKIKKEIDGQQQSREDIRMKLDDLSSVSFDEAVYNDIVQQYHKLEAMHTRYLALQEKINGIPESEQKKAALNKEKEALHAVIHDVTKHIEALHYSEHAYEAVKNEFDAMAKTKDSIVQRLNDVHLQLTNHNNKITQIEHELQKDDENRHKVEKARNELNIVLQLEQLMDGFRTQVLQFIKPAIAQYAGNLFNQLTQGRYQSIDMDEDFNFFIMDDDVQYPLSRFSGGEIDCANLCLRIAISNAIRDFSGGGAVGFMAFDEIFGSQDNDRRAAIMDVLYRLQEHYRQIFIISHIDDVKELFPSILHIQNSGTGSTATWLA